MRLSDFKVLTFDCYGTLIDWETGIFTALQPLLARARPALDRDRVLEAHAYHESTAQARTPAKRYPDLLATVYKRLAEEWGLSPAWGEAQAYGASVAAWPAFADSADALAYLKDHFKLVILSNVDNASFAASAQKLGVVFDAIFTAEDIGAYKPDEAGFHTMLACLARRGLAKSDILHTAESMFHDHGPANRLGLANCWIHRRHDSPSFGATMPPGQVPRTDFRFPSMEALARAHRTEQTCAR